MPNRVLRADPNDYFPTPAMETWSRKEFAQGVQSGGLMDGLKVILLSRVVGGVVRQRRR